MLGYPSGSKLARANVHTVLFAPHKTRRRAILRAALRDAVALTTVRCSHKTAILGAINSIHWLHDCRHSSLVVALALERLSLSLIHI